MKYYFMDRGYELTDSRKQDRSRLKFRCEKEQVQIAKQEKTSTQYQDCFCVAYHL